MEPAVDLVDETFIAARRGAVSVIVADQARWRTWWPDLDLTVFMDRGMDGIRWSVSGTLFGTAEIWLEESGDGVLLHYYLRAVPTEPGRPTTPRTLGDSPRARRALAGLRSRRALAWKRHVWALKDELEAGRHPGLPVL